jgi:hypothetical protein
MMSKLDRAYLRFEIAGVVWGRIKLASGNE